MRKHAPSCSSIILLLASCSTALTCDFAAGSEGETSEQQRCGLCAGKGCVPVLHRALSCTLGAERLRRPMSSCKETNPS